MSPKSDPGYERNTECAEKWSDIMSDEEFCLLTRNAKIPIGRRMRRRSRIQSPRNLNHPGEGCLMEKQEVIHTIEMSVTQQGEEEANEDIEEEVLDHGATTSDDCPALDVLLRCFPIPGGTLKRL